MSLKSLVNKSVIKSDLRRYWWLSALFAGMLFLTTTLPAKTMSLNYLGGTFGLKESVNFTDSWFSGVVELSLFAIVIFAIAIPALLFSYLHHKSAVSAVHSLPVKRESLYASHLLSAAAFMIAAIAINAVLMLTMVEVNKSFILIWAGLSLIYCFTIASFSAMASMLVGNTAAGIVLPFIGILLPVFLMGMGELLCARYLYGYVADGTYPVLKWVYIDYAELLSGKAFAYIAFGILCLISGRVFYKKRALENNSQILAFNALNPVFMYGVAICASLAGFAYITAVVSTGGAADSMWIGVPFGIAGIIIARMLILKSFKPKGIVKPVIVYLAMMFVIYAFVGLDITGFEKRVPNAEDIVSADVVYGVYGNGYAEHREMRSNSYGDMVYVSKGAIHNPEIYGSADIEKVIALHKALAENEIEDGAYSIPIKYTLSNGKVIKRQYDIDSPNASRISGEIYNLYCDVMEIPSVKANRFPIIADDMEIEYTGAEVMTMGLTKATLTDEQMKQLLDELKKDVAQAEFIEYGTCDTLTSLTLKCVKASEYENGTPITDKSKWVNDSYTYNIYNSYENTIKLLREWNLYNLIPSEEDVESIEIYDLEKPDGSPYRTVDNRRVVTDKAEIAEILEYITANSDMLGEQSSDTECQQIGIDYGSQNWYTIVPKMPE